MADTAKDKSTTAAKKERKPARTLEQQIEDLKAKAAQSAARREKRITAKLDVVNDDIIKAESKLLALLNERRELRAQLGQGEDDDDSTLPTRPPVNEGETAESSHNLQS